MAYIRAQPPNPIPKRPLSGGTLKMNQSKQGTSWLEWKFTPGHRTIRKPCQSFLSARVMKPQFHLINHIGPKLNSNEPWHSVSFLYTSWPPQFEPVTEAAQHRNKAPTAHQPTDRPIRFSSVVISTIKQDKQYPLRIVGFVVAGRDRWIRIWANRCHLLESAHSPTLLLGHKLQLGTERKKSSVPVES